MFKNIRIKAFSLKLGRKRQQNTRSRAFDVFPISDEEEASDKVRLLAREYAVIFVTEKLAAKMEPLLKRYKARAYPAVIPIPDASGSTGFGLYGIKKDVEKAIGADILFNRED